ncbi:MAG: molybdopterin-dependent oxidoreductase [Chloroflexi bacterium]|nr:molybdopterin-dependent oxidoreductase [Chloroflexota bacterium]
MATTGSEEKIISTACNTHCGGSCVLRVHVKDGVVKHIETDNGEEPQYRACLRCRAYRQRLYHPDRLLYPLKRVGERGEGKFRQVSWDEALDTVAGELKRVKETYGNAAILLRGSGGDIGWLHGWRCVDILLSMYGGYSQSWASSSYEGGNFATAATYGSFQTRHSRDDLLHSKLIIMWGWDPANSIMDTNTPWVIARCREAGIATICVDPRHNASAAALSDQWVPIRPGTDAAMLVAMAHVMITENLVEKAFIDKYTYGFDKYRDYVLGKDDGQPKTPAWAESITGVPATTIADLARRYATTKPAALIGGIAAGRTAYGEQYHRAAMALAAMTGNIGIHGGDPAGRNWTGLLGFPFMRLGRGMYGGPNPVEQNLPPRPYSLTTRGFHAPGHIHIAKIADAILKGKAGGYHADIKFFYTVNTNYLNQHLNINKIIQALKKVEFFVTHEQFMTASAKYADVVLPSCTFMERNEITTGEGFPNFGYMKKVVGPLGESKSHLDICIALAKKLGIEHYSDLPEEEWLREIAKPSVIPNFDEFKEKGFYRVPLKEPYVAFQKEIADPEHNPFPTPSGKIEFYSQRLEDMKHPQITGVPKYIEPWEGPNDPLAKKYPLQLVGSHSKVRALSQFHNVPWLRELVQQAVHINSIDARARGIRDGDMVRVFNDRGEVIIPAKVTERIIPGVADLPQGAWYDPDEQGRDRGGCPNVLTKDEVSPGGANVTNTTLVQVEKVID